MVYLLPDGTISHLENINKTYIDVAYIKMQSKIFNDLIHDLHKMIEENKLKDEDIVKKCH
jgi:hypothetical protein